MSKQAIISALDTILYVITGGITAAGVGLLILQGIGAIALGLLGAVGGWLAHKFVIPRLNKYFKK